MFILGHLGIGLQVSKPFIGRKPSFDERVKSSLPIKWVLAGTLFPDVIDKAIYYTFVIVTGKVGAEIGLISSGRNFTHSLLFIVVLLFSAWIRRSRPLVALGLGIATHIMLDHLWDMVDMRITDPSRLAAEFSWTSDRIAGLFFPFFGFRFPSFSSPSMQQYLGHFMQLHFLVAEAAGGLLLAREWHLFRKRRYAGSGRTRRHGG